MQCSSCSVQWNVASCYSIKFHLASTFQSKHHTMQTRRVNTNAAGSEWNGHLRTRSRVVETTKVGPRPIEMMQYRLAWLKRHENKWDRWTFLLMLLAAIGRPCPCSTRHSTVLLLRLEGTHTMGLKGNITYCSFHRKIACRLGLVELF